MDGVQSGLALGIVVLGRVLFWLAAALAVIALVDWLARTRRINPFGPIPRFFREYIDPLMRPVENRIVRAGGQPSSAPWWSLVFVVVGGLVLLWLLQFVQVLLNQASYATTSPGAAWRIVVSWAFGLLRVALIVRVVGSWFGHGEYSRWTRWSWILTEWMLAPLRRMLPAMGPVDISPLVAFMVLSLIERAII